MTDRSEFDHRPDPVLGRALREALSAGPEEAFVERVMARAWPEAAAPSWWEVMTEWARPALAAGAALVAGAAVWLALQGGSDPVTSATGAPILGDPLTAAGERGALPVYVVSADVPNVEAVMEDAAAR